MVRFYPYTLIFLILLIAGGSFFYSKLHKQHRLLGNAYEELQLDYASTTTELGNHISTLERYQAQLEGENASKTQQLSDTIGLLRTLRQDLTNTQQALYLEQGKFGLIESQIAEITGVVGDLTKLSETDEELLQKYSKVYFLNEHYIPESLRQISPKYVYPNKDVYIHTNVLPQLTELMDAAHAVNVDIEILSAYRSHDEQNSLKARYKVTYGEGANAFSADQGFSEHQLGTTIDFTTTASGGKLDGFEKTAAYNWLINNAYAYGFVLSYPEGNAYYIFEPWHWRFVGLELATKLRAEGKYFYDLDQREIDNFLLTIFE